MEDLMTSSTWLPRRPRSTRSPDHSFEVSRLLIQDRHFKCKEDNTLMMKKRQSRMLMMTRRWLNRLHFEKNTTFFSFISKKEYNVKSRKCNFYCWINKTCKKWNDPSTENASSIWIQTPLKKSRGENQEQTSQTTSIVAIVSHRFYGLHNGRITTASGCFLVEQPPFAFWTSSAPRTWYSIAWLLTFCQIISTRVWLGQTSDTQSYSKDNISY